MALTDEEKAKKIFDDVDDQKSDETDEEKNDQSEEETAQEGKETEESAAESEEKSEEAKTEETESETSTLTKQFPNLKGKTWEEYGTELEKAYQNSFNEALRLKKQNDDNVALIEEAKKIIANQGTDTKVETSQINLDSNIDLQYVKSIREKDMITSFDDFAKQYPQAREPDGFSQIEKVSSGVAAALTAELNRTPTYAELFKRTANYLGWQPSDKQARKDAAIKEGAASSQTTSSRTSVKTPKISEEQLVIARRMFPTQTDEEIVKDLAQYVN